MKNMSALSGPSIEQINTIRMYCSKLEIPMPKVTTKEEARYVIDDLMYRERKMRRSRRQKA